MGSGNTDDEELERILFPDHCRSCHAEWDEGYGSGEEPCCTKAASNIRHDVIKWRDAYMEKVLKEKHQHRLPYIPKSLEFNDGKGLMVTVECPDCGEQFVYQRPPVKAAINQARKDGK